MNMDPTTSLSFSLASSKGVYGLLLGSGISFSSGIPTGWDITTQLIQELAETKSIDDPDALSWYRRKYGAISYSTILEQLFPSAEDRNIYMSNQIEGPHAPDDDNDSSKRKPTAAHEAIADLIAEGYIKVVITTNFDRLLEQALSARGVEPTVIYGEDTAKGALPIVHSKCTIIKIHGDYKDVRSLNTAEELSVYPPAMTQLLERVFDEFGWIVCGWSATWDHALRDCWRRVANRRFTTYWTHRGNLEKEASDLVKDKCALTIRIKSSDEFFPDLLEKVRTIRDMRSRHPLEKQLLITQAKRYLSDPIHRIRLHDLITGEAHKVRDEIHSDRFPLNGGATDDEISARVKAFDEISDTLTDLYIHGAYWASDWNHTLWTDCLKVFGIKQANGTISLSNVAKYPGQNYYMLVA